MPKSKSLKKHKYIFVIGGVMSGVGKGIASSSIGKILQAKGFKVNPIKIDPYLNVDAGNMNPTEHGEVFVIDSGLETDQDMGNYERFMEVDLTPDDYITSGMVYKHVIDKERALGYGGKCVEAIPHITEEILRRIQHSAKTSGSDISLIEIGGTVGDYQNALFIEAARILKIKQPNDVLFIMVSYLPIPGTLGEMKTRPTQNAVRLLNSYGVHPDIIIARSKASLDHRRKEKIAVSCSIKIENVISAPDIESIYDVPLNFERDDMGKTLLKALHMRERVGAPGIADWKEFVRKSKLASSADSGIVSDSGAVSKTGAGLPGVNIAIVGKYFDTGDFVLSDAYLSVIEAVKYSSYHIGVRPVLTWLNAKDFENISDKEVAKRLAGFNGIIVPGGFGQTGIEGKLKVIKYAREHKVPYFGLCYGMQLMVIEYARSVLGLRDANTAEINPSSKHVIIDIMEDQKVKLANGSYGASMRLGSYPALLRKGSLAEYFYALDPVTKTGGAYMYDGPDGKAGQTVPATPVATTTSAVPKNWTIWAINERHRHRYEVNPKYIKEIAGAGMVFSGTSPDGHLMEIAELPKSVHPFFLGTQFHPEFKARPLHPHPLFSGFIKASAVGIRGVRKSRSKSSKDNKGK